MRYVILCVLEAALFTAPLSAAAGEKDVQPSNESYVKVRVEVREVLAASDKAITVAARDRMYNLFSDSEEISRDGASATVYTLNFVRNKDLCELAKAFDGKEVVVTGMSERRMVVLPTRPGGVTGAGSPEPIAAPTWTLQRTVEVTGLKSAVSK